MIAGLLLWAVSAHASSSPDFHVSAIQKGERAEVTAVAPSGMHFNLKAPHYARLDGSREKLRAATESAVRLSFHLPKAGRFLVHAYLCDRKETFCEKHVVKAQPKKPD